MSRIGKKAGRHSPRRHRHPRGQAVTVKGPKGELAWTVVDDIEVRHENGELTFVPRADTKRAKAMWGLSRTLVANLVHASPRATRRCSNWWASATAPRSGARI